MGTSQRYDTIHFGDYDMTNKQPRCADCGSPGVMTTNKAGNQRFSCCDCECTRQASDSDEVMLGLWADIKGIGTEVSLASLRGVTDEECPHVLD